MNFDSRGNLKNKSDFSGEEDVNLKKRIVVLVGVVLLAIVLGPITYSYLKEKMYYDNHIVAISTFTEVTILDKFIEGEIYYLEFTVDSEFFIDKYKMKDNARIYSLADKDLYELVDLSRSDEYIGLTIRSEVDKNIVSNEVFRSLELDPFLMLSKQEFSKFIEIVKIHQK